MFDRWRPEGQHRQGHEGRRSPPDSGARRGDRRAKMGLLNQPHGRHRGAGVGIEASARRTKLAPPSAKPPVTAHHTCCASRSSRPQFAKHPQRGMESQHGVTHGPRRLQFQSLTDMPSKCEPTRASPGTQMVPAPSDLDLARGTWAAPTQRLRDASCLSDPANPAERQTAVQAHQRFSQIGQVTNGAVSAVRRRNARRSHGTQNCKNAPQFRGCQNALLRDRAYLFAPSDALSTSMAFAL